MSHAPRPVAGGETGRGSGGMVRYMRRMTSCLVLAAAIAGAAFSATVAQAAHHSRHAWIEGRVRVCNGPGRCLTRQFDVSAVNSSGKTVARYTTTSATNHFTLRVRAGTYQLVASSSGLRCQASAVARRRHTTHQDITCLVP